MKAMQLLLVEDSASDVRLVKEALKETGVPVNMTIVRDGVDALEHLRKVGLGLASRPDLILLDLNLPRKNGREVLAEIKGSPEWMPIPVIVMTSSQSDDDVNQCYALNANCYITKPGDLENYIGVVRAIEDFWFFTVRLPESRASFPKGCGLASLKQGSEFAVVH